MEFYNFYQIGRIFMIAVENDLQLHFSGAVVIGLAIWISFFILQGVGLYTMAKRRGIKKRFLAFVPLANIYYMGKLAGECVVFGHKMKRAGLYAMIAQILTTLAALAFVFSEWYLYVFQGAPIIYEENLLVMPQWEGLTGFASFVEGVYGYSGALYSLLGLVSQILLVILMMGLLQKYSPKNYRILAVVSFMFAPARFIIVFVLRKNNPVNFEEYLRRQREAYFRRQQQYYGNYGNPYGNPYGRPPYGGNPYGNGNYGNDGRQNSPPQDPFEEFYSPNTQGTNGKDEDDFFN